MRPYSERVKGFTLIELMVVVTIIAIVTAAVVPEFSLTLKRNRQRDAAMLIIKAVFNARSRAARTARCHMVYVDLDGPKADGGSGGVVEVREYSKSIECSNADGSDGGVWNTIAVWSVGGDGSHAGIVGTDIAISDVIDKDCGSLGEDPAEILFEPTGGLNVTVEDNAIERFFVIEAFTTDGEDSEVHPRHVRISSGGSVKYTSLRNCLNL